MHAATRGLSAAQLVAGAMVGVRLARGRHRHAPLQPPPSPGAELVTVLVPARNEEHRIGPCLAGIAEDPAVAELIVIDDCSTDATAEVARAHGARVLTGREPAAGWVGKSWALQQGLEAASHDLVVCLDADTRPKPGLVAALAEVLREADFITAGPCFDCATTGERLLHPSMLASLVYRFGPGDSRDHKPRVARLVANGQCMAFRRRALLDAGGFRHAAGYFTDDAALTRALAHNGWRVAFRDGRELLEVRMHSSAPELWREWGRTISFADVTKPAPLTADCVLVALTMGLPVMRLIRLRPSRLDLVLLAVRWLLLAGLRQSYSRRGVAFWLSPLADPLTTVRLLSSSIRQPLSWRGRGYAALGKPVERALP